eukprot:SAG22_NODE_26_length_29806_cov_19.885381_16_plen_56_part_00
MAKGPLFTQQSASSCHDHISASEGHDGLFRYATVHIAQTLAMAAAALAATVLYSG